MSLQFLSPASSNRLVATYQTLLILLVFQLSSHEAAVAVVCSPRHHCGDTSPVLYADLVICCLRDATRHSCSHSTHRYSHSRTKHRHSGSRCCCHDRPHGLWGTPPFGVQSYGINGCLQVRNHTRHQIMVEINPPMIVISQSTQSQ